MSYGIWVISKIKKIRRVSPDVLLLPPVLKNGRRGVRVVEGARLESVYSGNAIAGSNPALSAEINYFRFKEIKKARKYSVCGLS